MAESYGLGLRTAAEGFIESMRLKQAMKLAEEEARRKRDEAMAEKAAGENLANLQALRSGKWVGKKPFDIGQSVLGAVNIPGSSTEVMETPSIPTEIEREPTPEEFESKILSEQQSLAKTSPNIFFQDMGLVGREKERALRMKRISAQTRRVNALTDMSKYESSGFKLVLDQIKEKQKAQANAMLIGDDEQADALSQEIEQLMGDAQGYLLERKPGLRTLFPEEKKTQKLTPDIAAKYLKQYGNRQAAEAAAKKDGYAW